MEKNARLTHKMPTSLCKLYFSLSIIHIHSHFWPMLTLKVSSINRGLNLSVSKHTTSGSHFRLMMGNNCQAWYLCAPSFRHHKHANPIPESRPGKSVFVGSCIERQRDSGSGKAPNGARRRRFLTSWAIFLSVRLQNWMLSIIVNISQKD
jgi:hypothetical protein